MSVPNLGGVFAGDSHYSPPRVNAGKWVTGTGDEIAAIPNTTQVPAAICIETGSGFIEGVAYYAQYDSEMVRTGWLPFSPQHLHDADDDIAGGLFSDIWNANMGKFMFVLMHVPKANQFTINKTGTNATIVDEAGTNTERCNITTGTPAANDLVTGTKAGIRVNWGKPIYLQVMSKMTVATSMTARMGIGMERMDQGTDDLKKMGLEDCSASTAKRQIVSADGNTSSRTLTTTTEDSVSGAVEKSHKLILDPGVDIKYYVNGVINTTKDTNIPASAACDNDRLFRAGIKTTNTTEKVYELYAVGIYYIPNDKWY